MLTAYFSNGQNATQAYRSVHPVAKYDTAAVNGHKWLKKAKVQREIAQRLQVGSGVTREFVQGHLLRALTLAGDNPLAVTTVCRELAEVAGLKIQKVEDVTLQPVDRQHLLQVLHARGLLAPLNH